jgi:hypothetical protein
MLVSKRNESFRACSWASSDARIIMEDDEAAFKTRDGI